MQFTFSVADLINTIFISGGIGISLLSLLQITASIHLKKQVRYYFQVFFTLILSYISCHLAREIINGMPGGAVRTALYIVTFAEITLAGFMAHIMSLLVIAVSKLDKKANIKLVVLLYSFLIVHIAILILCEPFDLVYGFDKANLYYRGKYYLLSNICPVLMLIFDVVLLLQNRKKISKPVKIAFWNYIIAPVIAIVLQAFSPKIQYIIFATVGASVYMFSVIINNQNEEYNRQKVDNMRIDTELTMASAIQADMLPNIYPAFPDRPEFDIYATMNPAREVGGDFYDFFLVDNDHLCMVMADVSGKGVPAALFMMASKIILANNAMMGKSPAQILTDTNNSICSNNRMEMFVTVWLGILEISTGKLTAANAGHEYPAIKHANGDFELYKDKHGFVIGGMSGVKYKEYEINLEPGSKMFLYTDGVPEATDAENKMFGTERMLSALNAESSAEPKKILENIKTTVDGFVNDAEQFDDLTMLCMEYTGNKGGEKNVK
ncbi:MAG: PP2C family protein-serine/threonine phosphatase [Clostridia bacterium]|nr:PP2C family protein-serine/threonine phosphatase [Clostridia bacterium]